MQNDPNDSRSYENWMNDMAADVGDEDALKPCPFCGKTDTLDVITGAELMDEEQEFWQHSESFGVVCNNATPDGKGGCGGMGGFEDTREKAIARWNTRHNAGAEPREASASGNLLDSEPNNEGLKWNEK